MVVLAPVVRMRGILSLSRQRSPLYTHYRTILRLTRSLGKIPGPENWRL